MGIAQGATIRPVVQSRANCTAFIPTANIGSSWKTVGFDDTSWASGRTGVGYEGGSGYEGEIALDLESDMRNENTTAYLRIPFNVTDASSVSSLRLRVKYDDGYAAFLNGREIARKNAPATLAWNSTATSLHDDSVAVLFEDVDTGDATRWLEDGENILAFHGLNDNLGSSDFLLLPELDTIEAEELEIETRHYFSAPSPGGPNFSGNESVSSVPEISVPGGTIVSSQSVQVTTADAGAVLRYRLDGKEPTAGDTAYSGAISITSSARLAVKTFTPGALPSPTVYADYVFLSSTVRSRSSNIALAYIDTFGGSVNADQQTPASATFIEVDPISGLARMTDTPNRQHFAAIKYRGSSSLGFPKKQYAFEFWNAPIGSDDNKSVLDLPSESDFILYAPYSDKSLMRNVLSYDWSNRMDMWAARCRFFELYMNTGGNSVGSDDYAGVYVLMDKIKRDRNRVDISRLLGSDNSGEDVTGGYILKIDRLDPGDSGLVTSRGLRLAWVYPKEDRVTSQQVNYLRGYLNSFESALYGASYRDPVDGYAKYINPGSFIDHHILVEMTKNIDGYRLSNYMHKDRSGKLTSGPVWDYNLSLGNADYLNGFNPVGWYYPQIDGNQYAWFPRLFQDVDFTQDYVDRWTSLRRNQFSTAALLASVDDNAVEINEAQERNFDEWRILGSRVWPNWFIASTWVEEVDWMKDWIDSRVTWMDDQFTAPVTFNRGSGNVSPGFDLTMTSDESTIYYTLDGSDPRVSGGGISASAMAYTSALDITENTHVIARVRRSSSRWSGPTEAVLYTDPPQIGISEIHYHPHNPPAGSLNDPSEYEFVELVNIGSSSINLDVLRLADAVNFEFSSGDVHDLAPGEYVVIVRNLEAFSERYDADGINIAGVYTGNLSNGSETLAVRGPGDLLLREVAYVDAWYPETDGTGPSLTIVDAWGTGNAWNDAASWRPSAEIGGSPGIEDGGSPLGGRQLVGDSNQDGRLDIADGLSLLRRLFTGGAGELPCEGATANDGGNQTLLDIDASGSVNVTDAVYLLDYLFQNGPAPAAGFDCVRIEGCGSACAF